MGHVRLRWTETLAGNAHEQLACDDNADILLDDADEIRLRDVLSHGVSTALAFDVHARLSDAGLEFAGLPYYRRALAGAELHGGARVLSLPPALSARAFHVRYHKCPRGGSRGGVAPEHGYRAGLAARAARDDGLAGGIAGGSCGEGQS